MFLNQNEYSLKLDLKRVSPNPIPVFVKNDASVLRISVFDNGKSYSLNKTDKVVLSFLRKDGERITRLATISNEGCIDYVLGKEEMELIGQLKAVVQIHREKKRVTTRPFRIDIVEDYETDLNTEAPELTLLQQLMVDVNELSINTQQAASYANEQGDYAKSQGDYAEDLGDYAKDQGDYAKTQGQSAAQATSATNTATQKANNASYKANSKADYAKDQGDYAKEEADNLKEIRLGVFGDRFKIVYNQTNDSLDFVVISE